MNRQSAAKHDLVFRPFPIDLNGFEKNYKVTNDGRIWSEYLQDFLKPYNSKGGYVRVKINFGDRNKKFMAHRLVAMAFIPNPDPQNLIQVDHINNDRTDNRVENLRWVTPKQNTHRAIEQGNRDWYKYRFIDSITGEILEFSNAVKVCKYFKTKSPYNTIAKYANTGLAVTSGAFAGWIIERESVMKVQRPSLAREQGKAARNGNHPSVSHNPRTWVLIWSDLIGNNELRPIVLQGAAVRVATHSEQ